MAVTDGGTDGVGKTDRIHVLNMPHTNHSRHGSSSGDDLGSTDEVKVFKDEGDREDENLSSEHLLVEEKSSLIDLTECEVSVR